MFTSGRVRVGVLIPSLNGGGAERAALRIASLLDRNHEVVVIVFDEGRKDYSFQGRLVSMELPSVKHRIFRPLRLLQRIAHLRRLKRRFELDCVVSFLDTPNFVNLLSWHAKTRCIVSIRNFEGGRPKLLEVARRSLYPYASLVVCVSEMIRMDAIPRWRLKPERTRVIYNPFNLDAISRDSTDPVVDEHLASFMKLGPVILAVGRAEPQKAHWHLAKAFSLVLREIPSVRLVLVGRGVTENARLESLNRALGIIGHVYTSDHVENPFSIMSRADVFVLCSIREGFPNVLVEAMCCGCPVVAADCPSGPREIIAGVDPPAGILIPALEETEDWDARVITDGEKRLAHALIGLLTDASDRGLYAHRGLERAGLFSEERCASNFTDVIRSVVRG